MITLTDKKKCCGCSACMNACPIHCITMIEDNEGFRYPVIDYDKCINCGKCERVCPVINVEPEVEFEQKAYLIRNMDEQILQESTSGGAFTAIAKEIIDAGGVVFGAAFDEKFEVHHTFVENYSDLKIFRNSKYVQSNIEDSFSRAKSFLDAGRQVLYSGTPCQIEGFWNFIEKKHYDNLVLVDIVCHSIPSPLLWRKYRKYRVEEVGKNISNVTFRDKNKFGYQYSQMRFQYDNGEVKDAGVDSDPYLRAFFSDLSVRPSCYECNFKKRYRISDITIWDCFDVYLYYKPFDDNRGVTRALIHTQKGEKIIQALVNCKVKEINSDDAIKNVRELIKSVKPNVKREEFFRDLQVMNFEDVINKWFPDTWRVKFERFIRVSFERIGLYRPTKRLVRRLMGKE